MTTLTHRTSAHSHRRIPRLRIWDFLRAIISVNQERRSLLSLEDHILRDIGLTKHQADQESRRRLWDLPEIER